MVGARVMCFFLTICQQLLRTKAALFPDGVTPLRSRVMDVRLQKWVHSLYWLPPAQASLTHRLVTCLEWTVGEHTREVNQRAVGQSSFLVNLFRLHRLPPLCVECCFFVSESLSISTMYFDCWALKTTTTTTNHLICLLFIDPFLKVWDKETLIPSPPLPPKNPPKSNYKGCREIWD